MFHIVVSYKYPFYNPKQLVFSNLFKKQTNLFVEKQNGFLKPFLKHVYHCFHLTTTWFFTTISYKLIPTIFQMHTSMEVTLYLTQTIRRIVKNIPFEFPKCVGVGKGDTFLWSRKKPEDKYTGNFHLSDKILQALLLILLLKISPKTFLMNFVRNSVVLKNNNHILFEENASFQFLWFQWWAMVLSHTLLLYFRLYARDTNLISHNIMSEKFM